MNGVYFNEFDGFAAAWLRNLFPKSVVDERSVKDVGRADTAVYKRCHFFGGIGGWEYALQLAGWPDYRPVWTGSCPCQPFSSAGKQKGQEDERHLWPEMFRLIRECRPEVVFGEQVASSEVVGTEFEASFIVAVQTGEYARANKIAKQLAQSRNFHFNKRWLSGVRSDLEGEGYSMRWKILGAHSVGSPHIRQRLYWVANAAKPRPQERDIGKSSIPESCENIANGGMAVPHGTEFQRITSAREQSIHECGEGANFWSDFRIIHCADGKARRTGRRIFPLVNGISREMGRGQPELGMLVKGARNNRVGRLKGYGNAIVPQVAAEFIRAFLESEAEMSS